MPYGDDPSWCPPAECQRPMPSCPVHCAASPCSSVVAPRRHALSVPNLCAVLRRPSHASALPCALCPPPHARPWTSRSVWAPAPRPSPGHPVPIPWRGSWHDLGARLIIGVEPDPLQSVRARHGHPSVYSGPRYSPRATIVNNSSHTGYDPARECQAIFASDYLPPRHVRVVQ